jgi:hypothetical protein
MKNKPNELRTTNETPAVGRLARAFLTAFSSKKIALARWLRSSWSLKD